MNKKIICAFILVLFCVGISTAQDETWNLERCILYAYENNLSIKQSEVVELYARNSVLQSKLSLLPFASADASHSYNFGNSIDPTTFEFVDQTSQSNSFGLSGNIPLFMGLQQLNSIKKSKLDLEASQRDVEIAKENIGLTITTFYLEILKNYEALEVYKTQLQLSEKQYDNSKKLKDAGVIPEGDLLTLEAQMARDELSIIAGENALDLSELNLKLLLRIPANETFKVEIPKLELENRKLEPGIEPYHIYQDALNTKPQIKSAELNLLSAEKGLSISQGSLYPTLSFNGSLRTNYFKVIQGGTFLPQESFGKQLNNNFTQSASLSLSIPLFSKWQKMIAIDNAELNVLSTKYTLESAKEQLNRDVYQAYFNAKAASKTFQASLKNVEAFQKSFTYAEEKFKLGAINTIDFQTVKNQLTVAESEMLKAKYDFLFTLKILDFYQGKPLKID